LKESAHGRGEVGLMVLTVEPRPVPSPKGGLYWEVKEVGARAGLEAHTSDNLVVSSARLIFQEVALENRKIRRNAKKCFMLEESTKEIAGQEAKSALKKGRKHHNFIGIGCEMIFTGSGTPLQHGAI
jgi:hypothetical protein